MKDHRDLLAWKLGYELAVNVYNATRGFPRDELFGLTSQIRRAATSVPANIAEGHGRFSDVELRRFCNIAHGSICELQTHLQMAKDFGYLPDKTWQELEAGLLNTKRCLVGLIRKLAEDVRS